MAEQNLKDLYFLEGIQYVPKLLELADRNRLNSTYGCFDRGFWHYRTIDFPSGMYQESVLPLALAFTLKHPSNPYYQNQRIREIVLAGIDYAQRSAYSDGSCDDYFPFERAAGATAFSLYACTEALLVLGEKGTERHEFLKLRANYLTEEGMRESGVLSNHKALIVLGLYNTFLLTQDASFRDKAAACLKKLLDLQTDEGWFPEYEGCDPGYLTFTIDFLAKYYQKSSDPSVVEPLRKAIGFASYLMHPDGSFGGEYGSRNTFHFVPHGFEIMAALEPRAISLTNAFLRSLRQKTRSYLEDDRIFIHYTYNYLQSYKDFFERKESQNENTPSVFQKFFEKAGFLVVSTPQDYAVIGIRKGGTAKIFKKTVLKYSDSGLLGTTVCGKRFTSQVISNWNYTIEKDLLVIEGNSCVYKPLLFHPLSFLCFRAFVLFVARFFSPNFIRKFLQTKAITKKERKLPVRVRKEIPLKTLDRIRYQISLEDPALKIKDLWISSDATFIYVATSQPFQGANLLPWIDLNAVLPELNAKRSISYEYRIA